MRQFRYAQAGYTRVPRYAPPLQQPAAVCQDSDDRAPRSSLLVDIFWFLVNVAGAIVGALIGLVIGLVFFWGITWLVFRGDFKERR